MISTDKPEIIIAQTNPSNVDIWTGGSKGQTCQTIRDTGVVYFVRENRVEEGGGISYNLNKTQGICLLANCWFNAPSQVDDYCCDCGSNNIKC